MSDETITDDYLSHLQALCDAATPGEWRTLYGGMEGDNYAVIGSRSDVRPVCRIDPQDYRQGNVHAIVVAHNALPQLIAEVRRLRGAILSFGNGNDFDWKVLGRIDELETENARLRGE